MLSDLTTLEQVRLRQLRDNEAAKLKPKAKAVRQKKDRELAKRMADSSGRPIETCLRLVGQRHHGVLTPAVALAFDDPTLGDQPVTAILADPEAYIDETLADPLEGVAYGRCKAKVMRGDDGWPFIHSCAHGRTFYQLRHDAASLCALIETRPPEAAVDVLVDALPHAELTADEEAQLRQFVADRAGVPRSAVNKRAKIERQRLAAERAESFSHAAATSTRLRLYAPEPDAELSPVMREIDAVLGGVDSDEPPMRNVAGQLVDIRERSQAGMHQLGANYALPAPPQHLLTVLDVAEVTMLVEQHIEYFTMTKHGERVVRLPRSFADAFLDWAGSSLPTVRAIVSAPLVQCDGSVLSGCGLDPKSGHFYRIEPSLHALVPAPGSVSDEDAVAAWGFLTKEWLVDVATDPVGQAVAIGFALTQIERVLLPERPAFFFTAAQRGGGKTTLANMLTTAVQGRVPAAAAWTNVEEERRKALMAYFLSGMPVVIWDNIERGMSLRCPKLEAALTAETYTDRILGVSRNEEVACHTVMAFTGNNIRPKGDLASRSLLCRINVDRPDPENRTFEHADPIGWTLEHRAPILKALYTLLVWGGGEVVDEQPRTRFKTWWQIIGRPLERVLALQREEISFAEMFAAMDTEDEEGDGIVRLYSLLDQKFGGEEFGAADVASIINGRFQISSGSYAEHQAATEQFRAALEDVSGRALPVHGDVTGHDIGKRLQKIVDRPAEVRNCVLRLRRKENRQLGNRYRLEAVS